MKVTARLGPIIRNLVIPLAIAFAILAVSFLIFSGALWLFDKTGPGAVKEADRYVVLRDVLVISLSATALFIAIFGTGAFFLLRRLLRDHVSGESLERSQQAIARSLINQGFWLWGLYQQTRDDFYVVQAITVTGEAYDNVKSLSDKKRENEELICTIRNNWGWYLAVKQGATDEEKRRALWFADYLEQRIGKYPDHGTWIATIVRIRAECQIPGEQPPHEEDAAGGTEDNRPG